MGKLRLVIGHEPNMDTAPAATRTLRAAAFLRRRLCECGVTQEQAAALIGKDSRQVRRWLSGRVSLGALELLVELERLGAERKRAA